MPVTFSQLGNYGRMANAIFQASATIALALRNNDSFIFPHWKYESFFNFPPSSFSPKIKYNKTYTEPFFHYSPIPYEPNLNIHGYMQSYKYWLDFNSTIINIFTPIHEPTQLTGTTS